MKTPRLIRSLLFISVLCVGSYRSPSAFAQGNDPSTAIPVGPSSVTPGNIESPGDMVWYSFFADEGAVVTLETQLVSLMDTTLSLYDSDGTTLLAFDDDGGEDLASRIVWTAPASNRYLSKVAAFEDLTGEYNFAIDGNSIPEPSCMSLVLLSLSVLGCWRRVR